MSPGYTFLFPATTSWIILCCFDWTVDALQLSNKASVAVWDGVLSDSTMQMLRKVSSKQGSSQHYLFSRPLDPTSSGPIERSLDAILSELGDDSKYVEFWTRQEWRSIEAHADVDEFLAKRQDTEVEDDQSAYRYPINGHVLYLQRGSEVRGPTCVFPERRSGGDLLQQGNMQRSGGEEVGDIEVVIIPAVPGRLLRFQGDFLHSVPRPHDLWFRKFVQGVAQHSPEDAWGRSVLLFNTWGNDPPLDVTARLSNDNETDKVRENHSNDFFSWSSVDIAETKADDYQSCRTEFDDSEWVPAKIWLLGNERRREHPTRTVQLLSPKAVRGALEEASAVSRFLLKRP